MTLLKAQNISHAFDYPLFQNVNFELNSSQTLSVVGVSGCGKSTLLHICSTLLQPNDGEIFYTNMPKEKKLLNDEKNQYRTFYDNVSLYKQKDLLKIRRYEMGIIFQSHYLFKGFSAKENIELSTILSNTSLDEQILQRLGIANLMEQNIGDLSGGQQQRISIARILSKKPKIIFADEPTGNLDNKTAHEVMDTLFEYVKKNGASLMLVTHDLDLAKQCDFTYELKSLKLQQI